MAPNKTEMRLEESVEADEEIIRVYSPDKQAIRVYCRLSERGGKEPVSRKDIAPLLHYLFTIEGNRGRREKGGVYRDTIPVSKLPDYLERLREGDKPAGEYVWNSLQSEEGAGIVANDSLRSSLVMATLLELRAWAEAGNMDKLERLREKKEAGEDIAAERKRITQKDHRCLHEYFPLVSRFVDDYLGGDGNKPPVELVEALKERGNMALTQRFMDYEASFHSSRHNRR